MSGNKNEGMLEVDDNFGLEDSDEEGEGDFMPQDGDDGEIQNFEDMDDNEEDGDEGYDPKMNGEDEEEDMEPQNESEEDQPPPKKQEDYQRKEFQFNKQKEPAKKNEDLNTKKVENQQFDEAMEIDDSNEIESDDDDVDHNIPQTQQTNQAKQNQANQEDEEEQELPGQYNPANYANLKVSNEVKELFEYIGRYKPQKINLETSFKPFIPEYLPSVGEVDAFLKMPQPDGSKETLGITVLDEPALNHTDQSVLEMKYIQLKKTTRKVEMSVRSIENAEKNPKDIQNWIKNVSELNKNRPPATVQYSKLMPDFDKLMEEWPPAIEAILREVPFPGPEIDLSSEEYAKIMTSMLDIPVHKTPNNKGMIEALHVMFTLYSDFKENQHFQKQQQKEMNKERDADADFLQINP